MPAIDLYDDNFGAVTSPLIGGFAVTPSDTVDLTHLTRGLMVTTAGPVSVIMESGETVTLPELQPGTIYPVRVSRVRASGTTNLTGIVGLY